MAIQFARMQYVSRTNGGNACRKSSYNMRGIVNCERTGETFNFTDQKDLFYHEVLLPQGANSNFKDAKVLWNEAENKERRINSQVCKEMVLALPDDSEVSDELRIELVSRYIKERFVDKGLAAQIDIHAPHDGEHNWHAHVLLTTRRFSKDGKTFAEKARDLDPEVKFGTVVSAANLGEDFCRFQNQIFEEYGLKLRVDPISIFPQEHIGPVRLRRKNSELVADHEINKAVNENLIRDPEAIILHLLEKKAYFTEEDLNHLLKKHYSQNNLEAFKKVVLSHQSLIPLFDIETRKDVNAWTSKSIRDEENKILRFAAKVFSNNYKPVNAEATSKVTESRTLKPEQENVLRQVIETRSGLSFIQGKAGTGKSHVMNAIRETYEQSGYRVVGLSPSQMVAEDMKKAGFNEAYNVHAFLYSRRYRNNHPNSKTVLIVDEASMLSNPTLLETLHVAKVHNCKVVMLGDTRQLDSVTRGGMYRYLLDHYGSANLTDIVRQKVQWQKQVNEDFSEGNIARAVQILNENKRIMWSNDLEESQTELIKFWTRNTIQNPEKTRVVITNKNEDVDTLNRALRQVMQLRGLVSTDEYGVEIKPGTKEYFSKGDRVRFTEINKGLKVNNGEFGTLINASFNSFTVRKDSGEYITFDPKVYKHIALGYAGTVYKSQGKTVHESYLLATKSISKNSGYVGLSRQTEEIYVFANYDHTKNMGLIAQLSRDNSKLASLTYATAEDLIQKGNTFFDRAIDKITSITTAIKDFTHYNKEFYNYQKPEEKPLSTITYNDKLKDFEEGKREAFKKQKELSNNTAHNQTIEPQVPSLANPGLHKNENEIVHKTGSNAELSVQNDLIDKNDKEPKSIPINQKVEKGRTPDSYTYDQKSKHLGAKLIHEQLKHKARDVAEHLLGEPNKHLSDARSLRFGNKGSLSISIAGEKAGLFHNFEIGESGNLLSLIQKERRLDFKDALNYASNLLGYGSKEKHTDRFKQKIKSEDNSLQSTTQEVDTAKLEKVSKIADTSMPIINTLADKYLREHRGIKAELPQGLKFKNQMFEPSTKQSLPALIAEARDGFGKLTAIQTIFLDKITAKKASLEIAKRSYGKIKGSFVEIQGQKLKEVPNRVYVAEGVETALSLKEAGIKDPIFASLGVSNYKNFGNFLKDKYQDHSPEVIIAADHDKSKNGIESPSFKTTKQALEILKEKGFKASIIMPQKEGYDFNDVLLKEGVDQLKTQIFEPRVRIQSHVERSSDSNIDSISINHKSRDEVVKFLHTRYQQMVREEKGREPLKGELAFYEKQAHKTADYLLHFAEEMKRDPLLSDLKTMSIRSKFELQREEDLRNKIISSFKKENENIPISLDQVGRAYLIAKRTAIIEGRLFTENMDTKFPSSFNTYEKEALKSFETLQKQTIRIRKELEKNFHLSEKISHKTASLYTQYHETFGAPPSIEKTHQFIEIAKFTDHVLTKENSNHPMREFKSFCTLEKIAKFYDWNKRLPAANEYQSIGKEVDLQIKEVKQIGNNYEKQFTLHRSKEIGLEI
jgi:Ti-type conjugative transfer relaxase TraA